MLWCVRDDGLDYVESSGPAGILWDLPLNKSTVVAKIKIKMKKNRNCGFVQTCLSLHKH